MGLSVVVGRSERLFAPLTESYPVAGVEGLGPLALASCPVEIIWFVRCRVEVLFPPSAIVLSSRLTARRRGWGSGGGLLLQLLSESTGMEQARSKHDAQPTQHMGKASPPTKATVRECALLGEKEAQAESTANSTPARERMQHACTQDTPGIPFVSKGTKQKPFLFFFFFFFLCQTAPSTTRSHHNHVQPSHLAAEASFRAFRAALRRSHVSLRSFPLASSHSGGGSHKDSCNTSQWHTMASDEERRLELGGRYASRRISLLALVTRLK